MAVAMAQNVGVQVLDALGLPSKQCMSLSLEFQPDCIVVARATYAADMDAVDALIEIVRRLVPAAD